jgi:membrane fusion protein (multidrug efflux system)
MHRVVFNLCFISCVVFASCKHKPPPPNPAIPVNLLTATAEQVLYYDKYPSTTQALSQVDLHAQVTGYITGIYFTEGSLVHKGQKLYEIDRRLYQQAYEQAVANQKVAQGNLDQAKQDADRYTYLNNHNAVAKQILDHAVIAQQNADNQVKAAEESVKTAATNLTYSIITAPFDGTIGFSQVKLGNLVSVGTTILNTVSTDNPMAVDFLINEKQLAHYQDLEKGKAGPVDSLFTVLLPSNILYPFPGKISVIDRAVDPQTGAIRIRLVFPNAKHALRVGMSCVVRVHNQELTPQIVIPSKAIVEQMGEYFVFVAKDTILKASADSSQSKGSDGGQSKGSDGTAHGKSADTGHGKGSDTAQAVPKLRAFQKKVVPGQTIGPNVIILKGIDEGEKVVVDGVQALHDGSEITLSDKQAPGQQKGKNGHQ